MRCRRAKAAIVDRTLGLLSRVEADDLDRHLAGCSACAAEARAEAELAAGLATLRGPAPFPVDVAGRVMSAVGATVSPSREEVTSGHLGWGLAAALLAAAAAGAAAVARWDQWVRILGEGLRLAAKASSVLSEGLARVAALVAPAARVATALADAAVAAGSAFSPLEPVVHAAVVGLLLSMATFTVWTVGSDLKGRASESDARGVTS